AAELKPILLSIGAPWCRSCHEMDGTSYADQSVAAIINARFVPVRVNADRRPDINERYNLGGWPTTAFLTAAGEILGGGTFVAADRLSGVLMQVSLAYEERQREFQARPCAGAGAAPGSAGTREGPPAQGSPSDAVATLCRRLLDEFDPDHGGFGLEPKFPHVDALSLALDEYRRTGDERYKSVVCTTLDAMGWGGLHDEPAGGFFRYAATREWLLPHTEKMLETNAGLLRLFLDTAAVLDEPRYRERAVDILRYLHTWLVDPVDGGFFGSQQANPEYYATGSRDREHLTPPDIDRAFYSDWNGLAIGAYFRAAELLDDESLRDFAITSLERVVLATYKPGGGVAHCFEPQPRDPGERQVRGLLADQVLMAGALLDAHTATGNVVYSMMAEELMRYCERVMWDPERGGFFDR
ncbi:MAG: DUF255 domain-containing protein, partial [Acidobacteria bacterium]|nr:DUF255 domain-containing protein [Acidobacteriota bacterium]